MKEIKNIKMWTIETSLNYKQKGRIKARFFLRKKDAVKRALEIGCEVIPVIVSFQKNSSKN